MPAPLIALLVTALLIILAFLLFRPERGIIPRYRNTRYLSSRIYSEDALKHIYHCQLSGDRPSIESIAGALHITTDEAASLLSQMENRGLLQLQENAICLTSTGREMALHIIRAHRLWERHLADETGYSELEWHDRAERHEHALSPEEVDALSAHLGHPSYDPHGDPIPTADGELISLDAAPLTSADLHTPLHIVHIEDEPQSLYAQLVAEGLHPGMQVRLIERSPERILFWANGDEHVLAPIVAANISVSPLPEEYRTKPIYKGRLADLKPGESGEVQSISPACRGLERRRLMDLGVLPGTVIKSEINSPSGDPTAYRIRGAVIALREEQSNHIHITRFNQETA